MFEVFPLNLSGKPAPPLHQAINSHHSLHFPLVHLSLLSHNQSNPTRWWASFSSAAEEPAGFIATELQIQVWKGWVHVQNKERKGLKAEAAKVRAQQREVAEQEFRQTLLKERAEKHENWKMKKEKKKMREEKKKKKKKNDLLRRQSSLWINSDWEEAELTTEDQGAFPDHTLLSVSLTPISVHNGCWSANGDKTSIIGRQGYHFSMWVCTKNQ
ncbi:uncharacterized protein LOC117612617 [Prunus dulcis]|uniref:uncharacterized protein LOC117612617 n=1 Tax=Prunus dulcis TaxID=3755 RepID=UPI001482619E|nr:uncharacterized protein LOC117612617 [Prunus dulcis]